MKTSMSLLAILFYFNTSSSTELPIDTQLTTLDSIPVFQLQEQIKPYGTIKENGLTIGNHTYYILIDTLDVNQLTPMPSFHIDPGVEFNMPNKILEYTIAKPKS